MLPNRLLLFTITIIFLYACKKEDLSSNTSDLSSLNNPLLKKVISIGSDQSVFTSEYFYDSKERVKRMEFSSSQYTRKTVADIEYDNDERLMRATYKMVNDSNIVVENIVNYTFVYDQSKIIKRIATPLKVNHEENDLIFTYDSIGRLIADSTLHLQTLSVERYRKYHWDGNNNIIKREDFSRNNNGSFSLTNFWEYEYDNNENAYLPLPVLFVNSYISTHLSRNNLASTKQGGSLSEHRENEYNNNGLLIKSISWPPANADLVITYEFFYD